MIWASLCLTLIDALKRDLWTWLYQPLDDQYQGQLIGVLDVSANSKLKVEKSQYTLIASCQPPLLLNLHWCGHISWDKNSSYCIRKHILCALGYLNCSICCCRASTSRSFVHLTLFWRLNLKTVCEGCCRSGEG